jgi:ribosomal protein S12 methylthiotransferase accessory factor
MIQSTIEVIGSTVLAYQLQQSLLSDGFLIGMTAQISLVCNWSAMQDLYTLAASWQKPWVLIEAHPFGGVAISPVFGETHSICFACYLQRRCSNGATTCQPAEESQPQPIIRQIIRQIEAILCEPSKFDMEHYTQFVISEKGYSTPHVVLPLPFCPVCQTQCATLPTFEMSGLLSDRTGIVHKTVPITTGSFVGVKAFGCRSDVLLARSQPCFNHGFAIDITLEQATLRAMGESVERYCAAFYPNNLLFSSPQNLTATWLDPRYPDIDNIEITNDGLLSWVCAHSLHDDTTVFVPASLVYLPYFHAEGETILSVQSSNGLATGQSLEDAIIRGTQELIERDTFMRAWDKQLPVRKIDPVPLSLPGLYLVQLPCDLGLEVVAAFLEQDEPPFTSVGVAARVSLEQAAESATLEALSNQVWLQESLATLPSLPTYPPQTLEDHARVHAVYPQLLDSRVPWLNSKHIAQPQPQPITMTDIIAKIPQLFWVDLTTQDIAAVGLHVVRVLSPNLIPLRCDSQRREHLPPHPIA